MTGLILQNDNPSLVWPSVSTNRTGLTLGFKFFASINIDRATATPLYMAVPPPARMSSTAARKAAFWFRLKVFIGNTTETTLLNSTRPIEFPGSMKSLPRISASLTPLMRLPPMEPLMSAKKTAAMGRPASFFFFQIFCASIRMFPAGI